MIWNQIHKIIYKQCFIWLLNLKNNEEFNENDKEIRLFNVLPLRKNIIGKNICIDTCALISNFLGKESTANHLKNYKEVDNQYLLWERFFRLNKKVE